MSIVVSKMAMLQYQLIFRHLFELKHVERQLNAAWQLYQTTRGLYRQVQLIQICVHAVTSSCLSSAASGTLLPETCVTVRGLYRQLRLSSFRPVCTTGCCDCVLSCLCCDAARALSQPCLPHCAQLPLGPCCLTAGAALCAHPTIAPIVSSHCSTAAWWPTACT